VIVMRAVFLALHVAAALAAPVALAEEPPESRDVGWWQDIDLTVPGAFGEWRVYVKDGLRVDSPFRDTRLKFNADLWVDGGYIGANDPLRAAFAGLTGWSALIDRARVTMRGWLFDVGDFKFQMEFAQKVQVKDSWFAFKELPYVGRILIGNMKEPFSLENLTSGGRRTFMSASLPTLAFAPGRNIGVMAQNAVLDKRLTWAVGGFWNTASYGDFGGAKDALSNSIGFDWTGRITGLPLYESAGKRLVHLGLSLAFQRLTDQVQARAVPETSLTNAYFVDTGLYQPDGITQVNPELAMVAGPWSIQSEYTVAMNDAPKLGDPRLRGFYVLASYVLTGEFRRYDRETGTFAGVLPRRNVSLRDGGWGAWEATLRLSYLNLNSGTLTGGKETDVTVGLNWYLNPSTRVILNYVRARVDDRGNPPAVDGGRANVFQARFQIAF